MKRVAIILAMLLAGCASLPEGKKAIYMGHNCAGGEMTVRFTEYTSLAPTLDCMRVAAAMGVSATDVALMVLSLPVACAMTTAQGSAVVLPPNAPDALRHHEYEHLTGRRHPPLVPFYLGDGC